MQQMDQKQRISSAKVSIVVLFQSWCVELLQGAVFLTKDDEKQKTQEEGKQISSLLMLWFSCGSHFLINPYGISKAHESPIYLLMCDEHLTGLEEGLC